MSKKCMSNHMDDFSVLKFFGISTRPSKVYILVQVYWDFPTTDWIKVNTEGAARGFPGPAGCGGTFRGSREKYIGGYSAFLEMRMPCMPRRWGYSCH